MLKKIDWRIVVGLLLITGGLLVLLENLNILTGLSDWFWGLVLAGAGAGFLVYYAGNRTNWWALIPGGILLVLGLLRILESLAPGMSEQFSGAIFMFGFALTFLVVYIISPVNWWAIIPAGVLATIGVTSMLDETALAAQGFDTGGIFFLGLGLTFLLVFILPAPTGRNTWAIFPAGALLLVGIFILASATELINYVWPALLILLGLVLIVRYLVWKK
jgi:hypothetical protein